MPQQVILYSFDNSRLQTQVELEMDQLANGIAFCDLTFEQQVAYCSLKNKLIDEVTSCVKTAIANKDYRAAVKAFAYELYLLEQPKNSFDDSHCLEYLQSTELFPETDPISDYYKGLYTYFGIGCEVNYTEAAQWLQKSAHAGFAPAQYQMGEAYRDGNGLTQDYIYAQHYYQLAAAQNYSPALLALGELFSSSNYESIPQNLTRSFENYRLAAEHGLLYAMHILGAIYFDGILITKDQALALFWFLLAAEQGCKESQLTVGNYYFEGMVVDQDMDRALYWYRRAAIQGDADALYCIANIDTPLAQYTLAYLQNNYSELLKLCIEYPQLSEPFFKTDCITVLYSPNIQARNDFLATLKLFIDDYNGRHNGFLFRFLIVTGNDSIYKDEKISEILTLFINKIKFQDTPLHCIKELIGLFCDLYFEDRMQPVIDPLMTLWHTGQMHGVLMMHTDVNKLIATVLVDHFLNKEYCLSVPTEITDANLLNIIQYFKSTKNPKAQDFAPSMLMKSKEHPKNFLIKLYFVLLKKAEIQDGSLPHFLKYVLETLHSKIQEEQTLKRQTAETLFSELSSKAMACHTAQKIKFFTLEANEAILIKLFAEKDTTNLLVWIEEVVIQHCEVSIVPKT